MRVSAITFGEKKPKQFKTEMLRPLKHFYKKIKCYANVTPHLLRLLDEPPLHSIGAKP